MIWIIGANKQALSFYDIVKKSGSKCHVFGYSSGSCAAFYEVSGKRVVNGGIEKYLGESRRKPANAALVCLNSSNLYFVVKYLIKYGVKRILITEPKYLSTAQIHSIDKLAKKKNVKVIINYRARQESGVTALQRLLENESTVRSVSLSLVNSEEKGSLALLKPGTEPHDLAISEGVDLLCSLFGDINEVFFGASSFEDKASELVSAGVFSGGELFSVEVHNENQAKQQLEIRTDRTRVSYDLSSNIQIFSNETNQLLEEKKAVFQPDDKPKHFQSLLHSLLYGSDNEFCDIASLNHRTSLLDEVDLRRDYLYSQFSFAHNIRKYLRNLSSRRSSFIHEKSIYIQSRIFSKLLKNQRVRKYLMREDKLPTYIFKNLRSVAIRTGKRDLKAYLAYVYFIRKKFSQAYPFYFDLLKEIPHLAFSLKAAVCDIYSTDKPFYHYFKSVKSELPKLIYHTLTCEFYQQHGEVEPDWDEIFELLENDFEVVLANKSVLAAFACGEISFIRKVNVLLYEHYQSSDKEQLRRSFTAVAAAFYRLGAVEDLQEIDKRISYSNYDWKTYMSLGSGKTLEAMDYRGKTIRNSFFLYYPHTEIRSKKKALVPEKDLCGEAFNALFYRPLAEDNPDMMIVCDSRLEKLLKNNFENLTFIGKTPRYKKTSVPEKFDKLKYNLSDYLDNDSYMEVREREFISIKYRDYFKHPAVVSGRRNGWFFTDETLRKKWSEYLENKYPGKKIIGVASSSTVRSRIRDVHMVGLEHWGPIFKIPDCVFINLNAALEKESCESIEQEYGIDFVTPEFDLYNDFDNLLALMSVLDVAIVPPNNLMDFAASVGVKSVVFSPTRIMRSWIHTDANDYIFSENVRFVFPSQDRVDYASMVRDGVNLINQEFFNNYTHPEDQSDESSIPQNLSK